jgi:predicted acyl esterase
MDYRERSEIRDGMRIDWDMPITMEDGLVLRCDIYRPIADGRYPVIMTYGPYGKWLHFEDLYGDQWRRMCADHPEVPTGSTNKYQCWEVVDPEKWVPDGYVCIRVDSRGAGRSPGTIDIWSLREAQDLARCVEWAGVQPWSNGKIGLNGISYYGQNQWQTAALQPKHLSAICIWEGAADFYRDMAHHGGIFCRGFVQDWSKAQVYTVHPADMTLSNAAQRSDAAVTYGGFSDGVTFLTQPLAEQIEITGPIAAKLWVSSSTEDADLFLIVRAFAPDLKEVTFQGALDAHTPLAQGWLRCSHRKLDRTLTLPYRPYHTHDEEQKLTPGQVYEVDVEIWPTCIVLPKGYRLAVSVRGTDYVYPGGPSAGLETLGKVWTGVGPFTHNDPRDRPPAVFGGDVTLHSGPKRPAHILLPVIPQ